VDHVGDRLRVGRRTRAAAVDPVVDVRELVGDTVGLLLVDVCFRVAHNVRARGRSRVGADNDTAVKLDGHDRGLKCQLSVQVVELQGAKQLVVATPS